MPPLPATPLPSSAPSAENPFDALPWPSPGDRIRADDFRTLSRGLRVLYDTYTLSSAFSGRRYGEAKLALAAQQYRIQRAISVFGAAVDDPGDATLDDRLVLQVVPVVPGERGVLVVLTEAVDTRRFTPNLLQFTYRDAADRLRSLFGDPAPGARPISMPQLVGLSLGQARDVLTGAGS
jgi:hypothetical protein